MKTCTGCGKTKPLSEFYKRTKSADGKDYRCRGCRNSQNQAWKRANRERHLATNRAWLEANAEHVKEWRQNYRDGRRLRVLEHYGGQCVCCSTEYEPHLTMDHIDGNGAEERREQRLSGIYARLQSLGFPPGYQVMCFNCNYAKHHLGRCTCSD